MGRMVEPAFAPCNELAEESYRVERPAWIAEEQVEEESEE